MTSPEPTAPTARHDPAPDTWRDILLAAAETPGFEGVSLEQLVDHQRTRQRQDGEAR